MNSQHRPDVLIVIAALAVIAVIGEVGMLMLIHTGSDPNALAPIAPIASVAVGALAGILATTGPRQAQGTPSDPVSTQVVNSQRDPVETHPNPTNPGPIVGMPIGDATMTQDEPQVRTAAYPADTGQINARTGGQTQ